MTRRIIIPAAGKAERFGGVLKECLPINTALQSSLIHTLYNADCVDTSVEIVITTLPEKAKEHMTLCAQFGFSDVYFRLLHHEHDLWGSIQSGIDYEKDGGVLLPDTITNWKDTIPQGDLIFGVFETTTPERFSVIANNVIYTKKKGSLFRKTYNAWGVVLWSREVAQYWKQLEIDHYDTAFNLAIQRFGYNTFHLDYYYDLGTFEAYTQYLKKG